MIYINILCIAFSAFCAGFFWDKCGTKWPPLSCAGACILNIIVVIYIHSTK
jgi:hypothetical protein